MSSTLLDIADAVRDALASVTYTAVDTQPVVVRRNWPEYDIEGVRSPVIVVTPGGMTVTRTNRTNHEYVYTALVWVGRHTPSDALADGMLDFLEEVVDELRSHAWDEAVTFPAGVTSPTGVEVEINPDEALQERNVWRAVATVQYTVFRATT